MALLKCRHRGIEMDVLFTGDMTITNSLKVKSALARISSEKSIVFRFNFSGIEASDITFIQLLISFMKTISSEGRRVFFAEDEASSSLLQQAVSCGIDLKRFLAGGDDGL